ncbi:hypothetical protein [Pseudoduganella aquatica]|uniref:hypothetical protein n=1 Tax=Pseudoduganella aquatica TaxID=2660641 RepID=UPI001E587627|nr:hypothetical protein [Pseudoduganella aquatica]
MKQSYPVENYELIERALGNQPAVTTLLRSGKLCRKVSIRRLHKNLIEVRFQDFDGSRFELLLDAAAGLACLMAPCFDGSAEESRYLKEILRATNELINGSL